MLRWRKRAARLAASSRREAIGPVDISSPETVEPSQASTVEWWPVATRARSRAEAICGPARGVGADGGEGIGDGKNAQHAESASRRAAARQSVPVMPQSMRSYQSGPACGAWAKS